ncbi:MAG: beta-galactosidase, partial [Duncaniella sp.]|nr:beta-galactosidase [Duncaniella sp.]
LGTTGVYVYGKDYDIPAKKVPVHAESEVNNESGVPCELTYRVRITDPEGKVVGEAVSDKVTVGDGLSVLSAEIPCEDMEFWSWGYGYLYDVTTELLRDAEVIDSVTTRTGFRKTRFADGKIWLNDRVIQMHGYAQRTSNEWPALGLSVPAWLSDYSNGLQVESGSNLVRWMHTCPSKQDVESCDRVGLIQAMPAGDAEKDSEGERWTQRTEAMRDAIIYNRNNPSILFYESGNAKVSPEHMLEMIAMRDQYDPCGGRASGSREMLDSKTAEYGGEMLYINKSGRHPMWAMEYSRDEGLRKYWDGNSYPYHPEGEGPMHRNAPAPDYNRNQDQLAIEWIRRWYDYRLMRPGQGKRVSSGGVKIIFSDTNTHHRGAENYRRSGATDAMRIPKDGFYAHQVMWDGWVDIENPHTYIIG